MLAVFDLAWEHSTRQQEKNVLRYSPRSEHTSLLHVTPPWLLSRLMSPLPDLQIRTQKHFMTNSGSDWQKHKNATGTFMSELSINFGICFIIKSCSTHIFWFYIRSGTLVLSNYNGLSLMSNPFNFKSSCSKHNLNLITSILSRSPVLTFLSLMFSAVYIHLRVICTR